MQLDKVLQNKDKNKQLYKQNDKLKEQIRNTTEDNQAQNNNKINENTEHSPLDGVQLNLARKPKKVEKVKNYNMSFKPSVKEHMKKLAKYYNYRHTSTYLSDVVENIYKQVFEKNKQ